MELDNKKTVLSLLDLSDRKSLDSKPEVNRAPDGGWGWLVCFACFMTHMLSDGVMYSFEIIYVELLGHFNRTKGETAWIATLPILMSCLFGPLIAALCNRFGCRLVCIAGALLYSMGFIISAFATNFALLYISLGIFTGFGFGMIYTTSLATVGRYFDKKRAFATGLGVCGSGIGTFIFGPITKLLIDLYTWRGAFLIEGALALNCVACGLIYLPLNGYNEPCEKTPPKLSMKERIKSFHEIKLVQPKTVDDLEINNFLEIDDVDLNATFKPTDLYEREYTPNTNKKYHRQHHNVEFIAEEIKNSNSQKQCLRTSTWHKLARVLDFRIFRNKAACLFMVHTFLMKFGYRLPYIYLPDRARDAGVSGFQGAWLISTMGISNTIGRVVFGFISDLKCVNRLYIFSSCSIIICGVVTALGPLLSSFELLMIYATVFGVFGGMVWSLLSVVLTDVVGIDKFLDTFGIANFFGGISYCIGPPGAGWLYDVTGNYNMSFIVCGLKVALSGAILFLVPCVKDKDTKIKTKMMNVETTNM